MTGRVVLPRPSLLALAAALLHASAAWPHAATSNTVLFDREIVRILNEHCVMCHGEGGPAQSLASYEETWLERDAIHDQVLARHMPPWAAVPGYGRFVNANRLTLRETRFIVSWVEGLGPRNAGIVFLNVLAGGAEPREEIRAGMDFAAWQLGAPERVVAVPEPGATGGLERRIIDLELESERRLAGLEYHPGARSTVSAVVFTLEDTGQWLATWTPWHGHRRLPEDLAYRLPRGSRIVAEFHTRDANEAAGGSGELGLHFAAADAVDAPFERRLEAAAELPARAVRERLHAETVLDEDAELLALWPDLSPATESLELTALHPDGKVEVLLLALDIPLEWPTPYIYERPVPLPGGTRLSLTAYVSNPGAEPATRRLRLSLSARRP